MNPTFSQQLSSDLEGGEEKQLSARMKISQKRTALLLFSNFNGEYMHQHRDQSFKLRQLDIAAVLILAEAL